MKTICKTKMTVTMVHISLWEIEHNDEKDLAELKEELKQSLAGYGPTRLEGNNGTTLARKIKQNVEEKKA